MYLPEHTHSDYRKGYEELLLLTFSDKITALGETGHIPGLAALAKTRIPWAWFMTWSKNFCRKGYTSRKELQAAYNSGYGITLDKLPELY